MLLWCLLLILPFSDAWSQAANLCDILKIKNCAGVTRQGRRSSMLSLPSPTASSVLNPATVSFDKGLGVEAIFSANNPIVFSLASGTGKIGGALISSSLENTFFGNRTLEMDDDFLDRNERKRHYSNEKNTFAFGLAFFRKKHFTLDTGFIFKRHKEIKRINPGGGISGRLGPLTFGASMYQDDVFLDLVGHENYAGIPYTEIYNDDTYQERFMVKTFSMGTKFYGFSFDAGFIRTKYKQEEDETSINIFSGSYIYQNFRLILAKRTESSSHTKFIDGDLVQKKDDSDIYAGLQVSIGQPFIFGINYNYFLLDDVSLQAAFFF